MPAAVSLRSDFNASSTFRCLTATSRHPHQSRRLLSLAAMRDGMNRDAVARIGGMDLQTLRDWVHRFNTHGPDGLKDIRERGHAPRLSPDQIAAFATIVETGPTRIGFALWTSASYRLHKAPPSFRHTPGKRAPTSMRTCRIPRGLKHPRASATWKAFWCQHRMRMSANSRPLSKRRSEIVNPRLYRRRGWHYSRPRPCASGCVLAATGDAKMASS